MITKMTTMKTDSKISMMTRKQIIIRYVALNTSDYSISLLPYGHAFHHFLVYLHHVVTFVFFRLIIVHLNLVSLFVT